MGNPESGVDFKKYITILKNTTLAVQIIPFVYSSIYIFILFPYYQMSEDTAALLDTLFYISPIQIVFFLILSRLLHLCRWHRMASVLPLFPQVVSFVDYYIIELTEIEVLVTSGLTALMAILLLISAYKVFLC